jgi:lysophospholipase L1-like esterase
MAEKGDRVGFNLTAIAQIQQLARQSGAQFLLAMTPLRREVAETPKREYELKARKRLQAFAEGEGIFYLDFLPLFQEQQQPASLYRDHIHLSPLGNHLVSQNLSQALFKILDFRF